MDSQREKPSPFDTVFASNSEPPVSSCIDNTLCYAVGMALERTINVKFLCIFSTDPKPSVYRWLKLLLPCT